MLTNCIKSVKWISLLFFVFFLNAALASSTDPSGTLTITMPSMPEEGLNNPHLTITGMGHHIDRIIPWNEEWTETTLPPGQYTITASATNNESHTYQAAPIRINVTADMIAQAEPLYLVRPSSWSSIKHVVVIMFENTSVSKTLEQPYFRSLISQGAFLSQYFAVAHPSQPNYLALIGGSTFGVNDDKNHTINANHIGNLLAAKSLTWKTYAESYPGNCYLGASKNTYYRKHEPFISFQNVSSNPNECKKIVPGTTFFSDLSTNQLPTFSLYVPDINNDGHNKGVAFADRWLFNKFGPIFNNPGIMSNTLFILAFDEDDNTQSNNVYLLLLGAGVSPGATTSVKYNHYSTLRTIEDIFNLGTLGKKDLSAASIANIWNP